jgi:Protein of unknown function (DUF3455)
MFERIAFLASRCFGGVGTSGWVATAAVLFLAVGSATASAQDRHGRHEPADPGVPANLEVPDGYRVFLSAHAVGTQNYICLPTPTGVAWRFIAPQATLFHAPHGELRQQLTTHFLSANPAEGGIARPTWQDSSDSSRVWGRALQSSADPLFVEPGAIPWLLLEVVGAERGPVGGAFLKQSAYIQRVNTSGGMAPTDGCTHATNVGTLALMPYEADYVFYRGRRRD